MISNDVKWGAKNKSWILYLIVRFWWLVLLLVLMLLLLLHGLLVVGLLLLECPTRPPLHSLGVYDTSPRFHHHISVCLGIFHKVLLEGSTTKQSMIEVGLQHWVQITEELLTGYTEWMGREDLRQTQISPMLVVLDVTEVPLEVLSLGGSRTILLESGELFVVVLGAHFGHTISYRVEGWLWVFQYARGKRRPIVLYGYFRNTQQEGFEFSVTQFM